MAGRKACSTLCRGDGDLAAVRFSFGYGNRDLEHAIAEIGFRLVRPGAFGQGDRAEEASVGHLRAPPSLTLLGVLLFALALDDQGVILYLYLYIFLIDSRKIRAHNYIVVAAPHFHG